MKVIWGPSGRIWSTVCDQRYKILSDHLWNTFFSHFLKNDYSRNCKYLTVLTLSSVFSSSVSEGVEMAVDKRWLAWWSCTGGCASKYKYLCWHVFSFLPQHSPAAISSPGLAARPSLRFSSSSSSSNSVWCILSSWCVGAMVSGGGWHSGFCVGARRSRGGVEDLGLRASSLEGGFGLTPLT